MVPGLCLLPLPVHSHFLSFFLILPASLKKIDENNNNKKYCVKKRRMHKRRNCGGGDKKGLILIQAALIIADAYLGGIGHKAWALVSHKAFRPEDFPTAARAVSS